MTSVLSMFSLEGKSVVVGGASRGIGFALAQGLTRAGAAVTGFGRSTIVANASFDYRSCDTNDSTAVAALFNQIEASGSLVDAYFHVAGQTSPSKDMIQSEEAFRQTIDVNLIGAYRCCREVGTRMARRRRGSIVTITSIGSVLGFPNNPGYVAAKGGLRMMSKALALDLGPFNVRVNSLVPGYFKTEMTAASYNDPELNASRAERTMLGRWGDVEDLVGAAVFLAADASAYVTGTDLFVDGGWTAKGL